MQVQEQTWHDFTRYLIYTDGASVQLELYPDASYDTTTAYIYALWVDEPLRRKGLATALMDKAEEIAREECHKAVVLYWDKEATPKHVFDWYTRRGYTFKYRDYANNRVYLQKSLD